MKILLSFLNWSFNITRGFQCSLVILMSGFYRRVNNSHFCGYLKSFFTEHPQNHFTFIYQLKNDVFSTYRALQFYLTLGL